MVREGGLEPPRPLGHWNLNPARLPIPPLARVGWETVAHPFLSLPPGTVRHVALKGFEKRLERMVEGTFARIFRSGLRPVELGRRLVREMDDGRSVDVRGRTVVPNHFSVEVSQADFERFAEVVDVLERELADAAREHARDEGYSFMGPVGVHLEVGAKQRTGAFQITGRMREGKGGSGAGSLVLSTGERVPLVDAVITIGRAPNAALQLADPNASRQHAEIRPSGNGWVLVDLGSTNGSRVNGMRVTSQELAEGDEIGFGNTIVRFEAS